ncbi:carboxypeptidase-like regulatory domain-containing protein [Alloacidobacterium sp.]|uniref:carboxypeptidase-like regulatory domain-containing protein n=1 Tax=Alloacidobacterium sp. TaxID=2951999 RepID=UPI002D65D1E8|nr:carboxypeptidase-like regulatory domain-containing protein [Alloacidobacterium sp.]HYK36917.1 carboxypeptidase-like regulatory domain-containing protein [Alloacidobacterium sp.]
MTLPNLRIKIGPAVALLVTVLALSAYAEGPSGISGVVRDVKGAPQVGALVELLGPNLAVISSAFTDDHGRYSLKNVPPGSYNLKASGSFFLPTLRENLRVLADSKLVVNLTLNTLYEAFRWLPAKPRQVDEPQDDWTWTLRLSANRPLLRMLEDGPLVVVSDGDGTAPALKARVTIRGGANEFGDGGLHHDFEMERSNGDDQQLILRADLGQAESASLNTVVGYAKQLAPGRTMRTVAAFEDRPDIQGGYDGQGLQAVVLRSSETMDLMNGIIAEVGNEVEAIHLGETQFANHPFAGVSVHTGDNAVEYHVATSPSAQHATEIDRASTLAPALTERDNRLLLEQGLHQEVSYARHEGNLSWRMTVYQDRIDNPVISGGGTLSLADWNSGNLLYDPNTDLLKVAGKNFSSNGVLAEMRDRINDDTWFSLAYATGDTLTMGPLPGKVMLEEAINNLHPRRAGMFSASMSGKLKQAGTQWRASYRWQPTDTVTAVDPFNDDLPDPYLSFYLRQPIRCRMLPYRVEALIDVRNLLAQGYRPFLTQDGSTLYFAQAERSVQGGLSFSF